MLVYPRLPAPTAELLIGELRHLSLDELRSRSAVRHPACTYAPTGGSRADERDIAAVRDRVREVAESCGFPQEAATAERIRFDREAGGVLLHEMRIVPADAAETGIWAFLACVVLPDVVCWRFTNRTPERLLGGPRNTLRRLWWRGHVLNDPQCPLTSRLGEDEIVQLMERPSIAGNPRVARALGTAHVRASETIAAERRMHLMRDAAKRLLRLTPLIAVDALDDRSLSRVADAVVYESARALGILEAEHEGDLAAMHLLGDDALVQVAAEGGAVVLGAASSRTVAADAGEGPVADDSFSVPRRVSDLEAAAELPVGYRVFRAGPVGEAASGSGITEVPLAQIRLAAVRAVEHGVTVLDDLPAAICRELETGDDLTPGEVRETVRLIRSAAAHRWLQIDEDDGRVQFVAFPSGSAATEGQLMQHSLAEIARVVHVILSSGESTESAADLAVAALGYAPGAGRTARRIVHHIAQDLERRGIATGASSGSTP